MPIYEYACTKCNKIKEEWVKNCDVEVKCDCGGDTVRQFPTKTRVHYKALGFHKTDYDRHGRRGPHSDPHEG